MKYYKLCKLLHHIYILHFNVIHYVTIKIRSQCVMCDHDNMQSSSQILAKASILNA